MLDRQRHQEVMRLCAICLQSLARVNSKQMPFDIARVARFIVNRGFHQSDIMALSVRRSKT